MGHIHKCLKKSPGYMNDQSPTATLICLFSLYIPVY